MIVREKPYSLRQTKEPALALTDCTSTTTRRCGGGENLSQPVGGKDPPKNDPTTIKINYIQRANIHGIKGIPRISSSENLRDCTTESHRSLTTEVHATNLGSHNKSI